MTLPEYDFIIVGGGTSGLVLASRLSENPEVQILILEAGENLVNDPRVKIPALWVALRGAEADWNFETQPQAELQNRKINLSQGKMLGGSSAMNAQVFVPPSKTVIDAWESLGNPGWNWETLKQYYAKTFTRPATALPAGLPVAEGPIKTAFAGIPGDPVPQAWLQTFKNLGYVMEGDSFSGSGQGAFLGLSSTDPTSFERSHAAAYYAMASERDNLHLLTGSHVQKILFEPASANVRAIGVQYLKNGETTTVKARKEVILSAGTLQSPKILELSGIGRHSLLEDHGINVVVENSNVGENLQDHMYTPTSFEAQENVNTLDDLIRQDPEAIQAAMGAYMTSKTGPLTFPGFNPSAYLPVMEFLSDEGKPTLAALLQVAAPENATGDTAAAKYYSIAKSILQDPKEASASCLAVSVQVNINPPVPGKFVSLAALLSMPLSRGSVHIASADSQAAPSIDPRFLSNPLDLELLARHVKYLDTIADTEPLRSKILKAGGHRYGPTGTSLEDIKDWVRDTAVSMWHPTSTCAMLPKDIGGVVDSTLIVYGTSNLRIVDASIMPLITRANPQSTVYAVAERAADIIKEFHKL